MTAGPRLRVVVIAPLRFPIRRPHAGGLESAVWSEVTALRARGHEVTFIGVRGSDFVERGSVFELPELRWPRWSSPDDERYPPGHMTRSVPALRRALEAIAARPGRYDVVSNHCLDALPVELAPELGVPMITTLHTPVDEAVAAAANRAGSDGSRFLAVSEFTKRTWATAGVESEVLLNGIDPDAWRAGRGGDDLVWFGRVVAEKAPHLAVDVARRLGRRLVIAGRVGDPVYAERVLSPLLGRDVRHVGPLDPTRLATLVGRSAAAVSTPAWAEPFGLVAPEALMTGTPVVSFAVGGVPEIAQASVGMQVVAPGDLAAMADRVDGLIRQSELDRGFRASIRASALARFSLDARVGRLEEHFAALLGDSPVLGSGRVDEFSS
ncbi:glycosyltransferase [Plantibacter sp. CFBP 8775]|uniref:glycosyltransferase n=1 Tax=Plantibacter sp. CFBP 8775 TaxID=2774038 RepID=UPI001787603D|nr:glycosyltransferase [Plantibacter sp. CFBP 8775]